MNRNDLELWKAKHSNMAWRFDSVLYLNHGTILLYRGEDAGVYIEATDEAVTIGTYSDKCDHITDSMFTPTYSKPMGEFDALANLEVACERMNLLGAWRQASGSAFLLKTGKATGPNRQSYMQVL